MVVALDVLRQIVVDHEPHVGLVDPHPESNRCHHHLDFVLDELLLALVTFAARESGVVRGRLDAFLCQLLGDGLCARPTEAVDDPALPLVVLQDLDDLLHRREPWDDSVR